MNLKYIKNRYILSGIFYFGNENGLRQSDEKNKTIVNIIIFVFLVVLK